jgi:isopentenyl-diphosphate delta-isomerase
MSLLSLSMTPASRSVRASRRTFTVSRRRCIWPFQSTSFDDLDRILLTRRALSKRTWQGVWTNTCCGHPAPGEPVTDAVRRRLGFELGLKVGELSCVLRDFAYTATDASGIVENEICPVFEARLLHPEPRLTANPDEAMDWKWVQWDDLARAARLTPFAFSPWAVSQIGQLDQRRTEQK